MQGWVYRSTTKTRDGRTGKAGYYRAKYRDARGEWCDHVIILPNGQKVSDKEVARSELGKFLIRVQREAAGLIDPSVEAASRPMRKVLADFIRHLRGRGCARRYMRHVSTLNRWIIRKAPLTRLADFNEANIDRTLRMVSESGRSPRTVNHYREAAYALGQWAVKIARIMDRNPVAVIPKRDERSDTRKVRRALLEVEVRRLGGVNK